MNRERASLFRACLLFAALTGCGGAAPAAMAPAANAAPSSSYASIDDAERDLAHAERDLRAATGDVHPTPTGQAAGGAKPAAGEAEHDHAEPGSAASPCDLACRALASMKRATEAVCRLAGADDPRCADAKKRLDEGTARAAGCTCNVR